MRGVTRKRPQTYEAARQFQLTRLMRGVTDSLQAQNDPQQFQLTRLMRGVT